MSDDLQRFATAPIEVDGTAAARIQTRMPSVDEWLAQAKLDKDALYCGMYLVHLCSRTRGWKAEVVFQPLVLRRSRCCFWR